MAKSNGQLNIVTGLLMFWLGFAGLSYNSLHFIQMLLGAATLGVSLWAVSRPSLQAVRAFVWLFLISGVWNLFLVFQDNFDGLSLLIGLLALAQLWWAFQFFRRYQRESAEPIRDYSAESAEMYDGIWNAIAYSGHANDSDFIEFQIGSNHWRGWLLGDLAVFARKGRKVIALSRENDVSFVPHVAHLGKKKRFYVSVNLDGVSGQGFIRRPSFDRYAQWKLHHHPGASSSDFQLEGTGKRDWLPFPYLHPMIRIPILIALAVILFYAIFLIIALIQYS